MITSISYIGGEKKPYVHKYGNFYKDNIYIRYYLNLQSYYNSELYFHDDTVCDTQRVISLVLK